MCTLNKYNTIDAKSIICISLTYSFSFPHNATYMSATHQMTDSWVLGTTSPNTPSRTQKKNSIMEHTLNIPISIEPNYYDGAVTSHSLPSFARCSSAHHRKCELFWFNLKIFPSKLCTEIIYRFICNHNVSTINTYYSFVPSVPLLVASADGHAERNVAQ